MKNECGVIKRRYAIVSVCLIVVKSGLALSTYGPHSTMILRTLSMPRSHTFVHSFWTSVILPWKFSWSNSMICTRIRGDGLY